MNTATLVRKIGAIRKKSLSMHGGSRYFVPYDRLLEILTEDSIRFVISTIDSIREVERQLFVTLVGEKFLRVLAILLYNHHEQYLPNFLYRLEYDGGRYFSRNHLHFLPQEVGDNFFERQWEFFPVVLKKGALHREVFSDYVLPFLEDTRIGGGGFGEVFKVKLDSKCQALVDVSSPKDSVLVVRKQIHTSLVAEQERSVLELVRTIQHPNIVEFLGSYTYQDNLNLLFPLAETDLRTFFRSECRISWDAVYYGIYGLADALQSIHNLTFVSDGVESRRIGYHHDLRPANILLRGSDFLIADFGLAKLKKEDETSKSPLRGGQEDYLAPEAFNEIESENGNVGRALDVWAFGCIVAEFATYIHGSDVEAFKRARKSSHWHGKFQRTDSAFHLDGKLRPAVNDWLVQLRSYPPLLLEDELIRLSRQMLDPIWRTRTRIGPVVGQLGTLALNRKVDSIVYNFLLLNPRPHRPNNPSEVYMTLESHRFLAWFECYKSIENGIKRTKLIQILKLAENLISCLEAYLLHPRKSLDQANVADTAANFHAIWDVVDELGAELPKRLQQEMNQLWTKRVMDIDDTFLKNINPQVLPNRYRVVGIKGTMKYLSGAISQSTRLGNTRMLVDSGTFDKDGSSFEFPDRIMGYYLDTRAILEWLPYDHRWEGARGDAMLNRVEALARLLNIEETPRAGVLAERVLNCLGYFHEKSMKRFGLIYVAPSPQPDQAATKCFSLNSIIQADSVPAPFLGDVFRMAFGIVKTVTALHEIGWLHKGISSENILIFSPTRTDTYRHVALAMLSGFSDSRPESEREMSLGPNQVSAYYHHPKYIASQAKFEKKYDFFSVGIVLLEIGLWYTMYQFSIDKEIRYPDSESWAEQNRNTLLEKYVPQLGGRMGKWYQDAVAFCLDVDICLGSLEGNNTEGSSTAQEAFQENVVARLARCSA